MRVFVADPETGGVVERELVGDEMPCQIGVYCDGCGDTEENDYVVRESMTQTERFEVARAYLRTQGWLCGSPGDFCRPCKGAIEAGGEGS